MKHYFIACLITLILFGCSEKKRQDSPKPNVVIILTDDLGYGDVSKFNPDSKILTPNIDALAEAGIWCTDAHSTSSICSPSRYSMLTGRYAWRGKLKEGVVGVCEEPAIEAGRYCLPQMFKDEGYNTACIGKWHLGFFWPWKDGIYPSPDDRRKRLNNDMFDWSKSIAGGPLSIGFDHYFGDDVPNFPPYAFIEDTALTCKPVHITRDMLKSIGIRGGLKGNGPGQTGWKLENVMPTITGRATEYVREMSQREEPFFLYFATTSPHTPIVPLSQFQRKSQAGYYGDYVVQTDDAVGQVIEVLKENHCFDNTVLIVTSDNGPSPMIRDVIRDFHHYPASGLRGLKYDSWEGGNRIPFVISWPNGGLAGGQRSDALISLVDIFGTLAGLLGHELPDGCAEDSYNILVSLKEDKAVRNEMVYQNAEGHLGLRQDDWVLLEGSGGREEAEWMVELFNIQTPDAPIQLFNLNSDLGEKVNIYEKHPEKVQELKTRLKQIREQGYSTQRKN